MPLAISGPLFSKPVYPCWQGFETLLPSVVGVFLPESFFFYTVNSCIKAHLPHQCAQSLSLHCVWDSQTTADVTVITVWDVTRITNLNAWIMLPFCSYAKVLHDSMSESFGIDKGWKFPLDQRTEASDSNVTHLQCLHDMQARHK